MNAIERNWSVLGQYHVCSKRKAKTSLSLRLLLHRPKGRRVTDGSISQYHDSFPKDANYVASTTCTKPNSSVEGKRRGVDAMCRLNMDAYCQGQPEAQTPSLRRFTPTPRRRSAKTSVVSATLGIDLKAERCCNYSRERYTSFSGPSVQGFP
ncbi:hypothetical protein CC86DRAFT_181604 [Ophiobolus disseminans]|uniref:Uncharacterized protein n=1 Tax=Ophiobolus disseminans TaxID=1469910 RepID=A0A6A7AA41_9PLEO|nr:hypothetical protein CC86DRAFT_181604 [Ophiobolus disseminans]